MKAAYPGFKDEQRKPYTYNLAGFLADKMSGKQGYLTSEPYAIENEGGFTPDVFLMADAGYTTYSTMIDGMSRLRRRPTRRHQALRRGLDRRLVQLPLRRQQGRQRR